jgi:signal transduction histidine kinase
MTIEGFRRAISHPVTRAVLFALGFCSGVLAGATLWSSLRLYLGLSFTVPRGIPASLTISFSVISSIGLICSVWVARSRVHGRTTKTSLPWRRLDFTIVALSTVSLTYWSYQQAIRRPADILLWLFVAYVASLALVLETIARIRDRAIGFSWPAVFHAYPVHRSVIGFTLAALPAQCVVVLVYSLTASPQLIVATVAVGILVGLTVIAQFLVSERVRFDAATEAKINSERFKSELITNVSHDVRTPLTSVINYVGLLKELPIKDSTFVQYVEVLDRKSARLKTLLDDPLDASKSATGAIETSPEVIDIRELVWQAEGEFDDAFETAGLKLVVRQPDDPVMVRVDPKLLWRVVGNLFANISKYAQKGTRVFVEIAAKEPMTTVTLRNISAEPIDIPGEQLMEQFIRGDHSRTSEGSGLGLYIARNLMELLEGTLTITATGDLFSAELAIPAVRLDLL